MNRMTDENKNAVIGPEEGELVVCTVTEVKQNGAYVSINGYDKTNGFIFIGEIASGWVKNIRGFVRDGQRVVCKVLRRGRKDLNTYELSLKSVSEERKRDTLQAWKNEQRATQLLKVIGEKVDYSSLPECFENANVIVFGCAHKGIRHTDILKHLKNMMMRNVGG